MNPSKVVYLQIFCYCEVPIVMSTFTLVCWLVTTEYVEIYSFYVQRVTYYSTFLLNGKAEVEFQSQRRSSQEE